MNDEVWKWITLAFNIGGAAAYFYIIWKNTQLRKVWLQEIQQTQREREVFNLFIRKFLQYQKELRHDR
jgi:hypothetical protein